MQLEILTFCDAATDHAGKLNILGATDSLVVPGVPLVFARCCIVMRFRVSRVESGDHTVRLMIIDVDGRTIMNMDGKMGIHMTSAMTSAVNVIINLTNLEFQEAGEYAIEVAVDGIQIGSSPLFVRVQPPPGRDIASLRDNGPSEKSTPPPDSPYGEEGPPPTEAAS